MNRQEKYYKLFIEKVIEKYTPILFLEKYAIDVEKKNGDNNFLSCRFNHPYLDTTVWYSDRSMKDWVENKKRHERRIVHELCHIVTDHFYDMATYRYADKGLLEDARENLTDHIANIVYKNL